MIDRALDEAQRLPLCVSSNVATRLHPVSQETTTKTMTNTLNKSVDEILAFQAVLAESCSGSTVNDLIMMSIIGRSVDGVRPSEIAKIIRTSNANVTGRLDRLEKRGLAQRSARKGDRRCIPAKLTPRGREVLLSLES